MFIVTITLSDGTEELQEPFRFSFTDSIMAREALEMVQTILNDYVLLEGDRAIVGRVVTPVPPNKVKSIDGIVSPKPPLQVEREEHERFNDLPEDLKDV